MKNSKLDEIQINISVIGLSGSENIKGVYGVGKSCLCNRLAQPNFYKQKHNSIISSIDFYGSMINQTHWLYWNYISKEIRGKKYKFHFIEQTIFIDDVDYREFKTNLEPHDFIKRASMIELRMNKIPYTKNHRTEQNSSINSDEKFTINLFLLVFDVSEVEKRNIKSQETIFKQLFDVVIATKRPLIIVTTKNDVASQNIVDKFKSIIEKRPYNKYPIVETSSKLEININHIYDLAASLCDSGMKHFKQICYNYSEGFVIREKEDDIHRRAFMKLVEQTLVDEKVFITWEDFSKSEDVKCYIRRFSCDTLLESFKKLQQSLIMKRRAANNQRFKEILQAILKEFDHLIPLDNIPTDNVIENLKNEKAFLSHFTDFDREMEYFKFDSKIDNFDLIPRCLLDASYENNLLFLISEYVKQKQLENQLTNHLIEDHKKYYKKSMKELRDELTKAVKHFIPDKVIKSVYDKFQSYYVKNLQKRFLNTIHENPNLFLSQNIFKVREIHKSWTINGVSTSASINLKQSSNDKTNEENSFLHKMIKEMNKLVIFEDLSILQDENNIREKWLREYMGFMLSKDELECIIHNVSGVPCSLTLINQAIYNKIPALKMKEDVRSSHSFYVSVLGNSICKSNFKNCLLSRLTNLPLKICKVHSSKFNVEIIQDLRTLMEIYGSLASKSDKCSILCVVILVDVIDELESVISDLENFLSSVSSEILLTKYLMCNIDTTDSHDIQLIDTLERNKYTAIHLPPYDSYHQTIDWIVSSAQRSAEQNIIWIVTVCGDTYDLQLVVKFLLDAIQDFCFPFHWNISTETIIGSSNEIIVHNYRLVFISYHQVMKLMIQSFSPPTVDAIIFVCSLDRLASINTCLAIKKHLPSNIASSCHCMLLCVGDETTTSINEQISTKSIKYALEYVVFNIKTADNNDANEDAKVKLFNFFKGMLSMPGTLESTNSIPSNSSSSVYNTNKTEDNLFRYLNKSMCQACCDSYRSDISVYANSSLANFQNSFFHESGSYDQVLGDTNENIFHFWSPEFMFDGAQDICNKCTKVNCNYHIYSEIQNSPLKSFRTRIRSQSGPDLRNPIDFNHIATNNMESIFYCSICGQDLNKSPLNHSNRQSFRLMRQNGTKESIQKTFAAKLQDLFHPLKKFSEAQSNDNRKLFIRPSSKRPK